MTPYFVALLRFSVSFIYGWLLVSCANAAYLSQRFELDHSYPSRIEAADGVALVGTNLRVRGTGSVAAFDTYTGEHLYTLQPPELALHDRFGQSIAIGGGRIAVGAIGHRTNRPGFGAAFIFDLATGVQTAKLLPQIFRTNESFGSSIAASDRFVLVGAHNWQGTGSVVGSAHLFDAETGQFLHEFTPPDMQLHSQYGSSVALDGDYAFVSAPDYRFFPDVPLSGAVFQYDIRTGELVRTLGVEGRPPHVRFGNSIDADGCKLVVGAPFDDTSNKNAGAAYVYDVESGGLISELLVSNGEINGALGASVSISGDRVLTSALRFAGGRGESLFTFEASSGKQIFEASGAPFGDYYVGGQTLEIVGDVVITTTLGRALVFQIVPEPSTALLLWLLVPLACTARPIGGWH